MIYMVGKIILTAQGFFNEKVKDKFLELVGDPNGKRIAMIVTASRDKENNKFNVRDKDTLGSLGFKVDFVDLETEPNKDLSGYDVFFVCGGNTFKLLKYAKEANLKKSIEELLERGGVYFGISCGSLIVGPSVNLAAEVTPDTNDVALDDFSGLNLIPLIIYPHYVPEVESDIVKFENKYNVKVQRLTNEEALVLSADTMTPEKVS